MNDARREHFRALINARLAELSEQNARGATGKATVQLDQQSVGRLSRMDALQNQAMAKATDARRASERARLLAALVRMDEGEYGYCEDCGEDIVEGRLTLDPAVTRCVECARG